MIKQNKVKHLNRTHEHRKAMLNNMLTSLLEHERIESTVVKLKVLRSYVEKTITKAKKNLKDGVTPDAALHNKREVMKSIKNRDVIIKLFEDIAPRFKERNGGYTRIYKLINRPSDNSEMGILELVEKKSKADLEDARKARQEAFKQKKDEKKKNLTHSKSDQKTTT